MAQSSRTKRDRLHATRFGTLIDLRLTSPFQTCHRDQHGPLRGIVIRNYCPVASWGQTRLRFAVCLGSDAGDPHTSRSSPLPRFSPGPTGITASSEHGHTQVLAGSSVPGTNPGREWHTRYLVGSVD